MGEERGVTSDLTSADPSSEADELRRLVAAVAAENQIAFDQLVRRTARFVTGRCLAIVRSRDLADDATQRVYVKVWQQASRFDAERGSVIAWLSVIARNTSVDLVRTEERASRRIELAAQDMSTNVHELPDHGVAFAERSALAAALAELPDEQRRPIELAFYGDLSYQQVAATLGQPEGTVKSRIRRGLLRLAEIMGEGQ